MPAGAHSVKKPSQHSLIIIITFAYIFSVSGGSAAALKTINNMTIRIPDGNAFRIRLTARNLITGEYTEAADLSNIDNLVINYVRRGIRFPHAYTIDEEGRATVADAGTLDCGFYGIELTGYYGGEKFRFYGKDLFEITTDTTDVIDPSNLIDIEITVKLNASGVSKDYVDHAVNGMEASMETMQADLRDEIAEAGKVDDVKVNGVSVVSGKKANITVPTKVSDLNNDSGYQTAEQVEQAVNGLKINSVGVSVDNNTGVPSGSGTITGNRLEIELHNIKGAPFTYDDYTPEQLEELRGPQGPQGDSVLVGQGDLPLANTTGYANDKAISQKAVTEELDKFTKEDVPAPTWYNGTVTSQGYGTSSTERYLAELIFANNIGKVVFTTQSNESKFYVYSVREEDGTDVFALESGSTAFTHPSSYTLTPEPGKRYIVRLGKDAVSRSNWTQAAKPKITKYYNSYTHQIDNNTERIDTIESGMMRSTETPAYKYGLISSQGYDWTNKGNKVSPEMVFDPAKVSTVKITLPESGAQFALYTIVGSTIAIAEGMSGYTTNDFSFTPVSGTKYVIRFVATSGSTRTHMDALPVTAYPKMVINYVDPSVLTDSIKERLAVLETKKYGYRRHYANVTGLLNFENKAISTNGIENSQAALLAKLPSCGCVEVKMNKPAGGFSVWKKVGNTITCLQAYTHYQYRYTGDYSSEYYVMIQAESGESLNIAIASVYTYSDEGIASSYAVPSWATGAKIAFIGDSIVQGRYPKNGSDSVNICMDKPWPNLVAEALGTEDFINFAIGGATVYDSDWRSLSRNASLISGYDIVFVCGGTNDYGNKTSQANFESAYADMLATLKANNTMVIAMTPVYRTKTVSSPAMNLTGYCNSIASVAAAANVQVIDMHSSLTNSAEFTDHLVDGLHPDEAGQRIIADILIDEINKIS